MYYCKPVGEQQKRLPCRERLPFPQDALAFAHVSARDLQGVGHLIPRWRFHIREGQHGIREACALYFDRRNRLGQLVKFGVRELH